MKKLIVFTFALLCLASVNTVSAATKVKSEPVKKAAVAEPAKKVATVAYWADVDCETCAKKIMNVIPYQTGVKDVKVSVAKKRVDVTYDPSKTTPEKILKAFSKTKIKARKL